LSEHAIKIKNLNKTFKVFKQESDILIDVFWPRPHKAIRALKNVNLEIKKGEVFGLIGFNGSGKTTLLKVIAGILVPNDGAKIEVNGTLGTMIALGSGFNDDLTGRENIYYRAELIGMSRQSVDNNIETIIEYSELKDRIDDRIMTYSSGMKARLGFAFNAFIEPDILIVDEITAVGDIKFKEKARNTIRGLFDSNKTILFVSHNLNEIVSYCTRVAVIKNGKIKEVGDAETIVRKYKNNEY
jgi:ABC-type polysaccharide/polyol phosphate transport system ATPase subunit